MLNNKKLLTLGLSMFTLYFNNLTMADEIPYIEANQPINISSRVGETQIFQYVNPIISEHLNFSIEGGSGDADLYVKFGSVPTPNDYDCRPYLPGNNENCDVDPNLVGTYYILIYAYRTYDHVTLIARGNICGDCPPPDSVLQNNIPKLNLSTQTGQELYYSMDVPGNAFNVTFRISGGNGDADLYVRSSEDPVWPSETQYDCRPYLNGNNETCDMGNASGHSYWITIRAYQSFSGLELVGSYSLP